LPKVQNGTFTFSLTTYSVALNMNQPDP